LKDERRYPSLSHREILTAANGRAQPNPWDHEKTSLKQGKNNSTCFANKRRPQPLSKQVEGQIIPQA
jgi:hypothetical protein